MLSMRYFVSLSVISMLMIVFQSYAMRPIYYTHSTSKVMYDVESKIGTWPTYTGSSQFIPCFLSISLEGVSLYKVLALKKSLDIAARVATLNFYINQLPIKNITWNGGNQTSNASTHSFEESHF